MLRIDSRPVGPTGNAGCFARIAPTSRAYATMPVAEALDWNACARRAGPGEWYLVAFRSVLRSSADEARLWEYDRRAFEEARTSAGFVHYFRGLPNERGECLSFCLWESREHARAAARRPAHLDAVGLIREMYERYTLELLEVRTKGPEGAVTFHPRGRIDVR
jgi:hypothetical protein